MMNFQIVHIKRWLVSCLLFFAVACTRPAASTLPMYDDPAYELEDLTVQFSAIQQAKKQVKNGDLVLRTGRDFTSDIMRRMSEHDKRYSHAGIASWENDSLFVYHALGGEWNPDQTIRRDTFGFFCNPYENSGFAVYRYAVANPMKENFVRIARRYFEQKVRFDMQFDLETNDRMYCSEFVYKTIRSAGDDSLQLNTTTTGKWKYVTIENLAYSDKAEEVLNVRF